MHWTEDMKIQAVTQSLVDDETGTKRESGMVQLTTEQRTLQNKQLAADWITFDLLCIINVFFNFQWWKNMISTCNFYLTSLDVTI